MRKSAVFVLLLSMLLCLSSCAVRNSGQDSSGESGDGYDMVFQGVKYKLTFEDEFEGDTLDVSRWEYCPDTWDRGDFYWSDDATRVENGNLILSVLPKDGTEYYCGGIRSRGLFEQARRTGALKSHAFCRLIRASAMPSGLCVMLWEAIRLPAVRTVLRSTFSKPATPPKGPFSMLCTGTVAVSSTNLRQER